MEQKDQEKAKIEMTRLIEAMAANEMLLSQLYEKYSSLYPSYEAFWKELSGEEKIHFGWLNLLARKIGQGELFFNQNRFKKEAVDNFTNHAKSMLDDANDEKKSIDLLAALSIALDMEESLLENRFFDVFETDSVELRHTLDNLRVNTEEHRDKVKRIWEQKRVRQSTK